MRIDAPQFAEIGDVSVRPPEVKLADFDAFFQAELAAVRVRVLAVSPALAAARDALPEPDARVRAAFGQFMASPDRETM